MALTLDRLLTANQHTAINSSNVIAVPLLYLDFSNSGFQKYFSGAGIDILVPANSSMPSGTYIGVGGISTITAVQETTDLQAPQLECTLNGIDSTYVSLVLSEQYFGGQALLGLAVLDDNYSLIDDPIVLFNGFMSKLKVNMEQEKADITVIVDSILADWERPRVKRYNSETQEELAPGDKGFHSISKVVNKEITWGG